MSNKSARETVKDLLLDHVGADNPITSREINEVIDKDNVGSFPGTRAIIRDIMIEDHIPVVGSPTGYYVAETEKEIQDYIDNLEQRIMGMTERRFAIKRAARLWEGELEEDDDIDLL